MDTNSDGSVTKDEAIAFWGSNFAKVKHTPRHRAARSLAVPPLADRRRRRARPS